jgi:hypothetical protein
MATVDETVLRRFAMKGHRISILALATVMACGSSNGPAGDPPLDPAPPDGGQQVASETYQLASGQEIYMCYTFTSPTEDVAITKAESISVPGVHHLALFQTFGQKEEEGAHECDTPIKLTWMPVFVTGTGSKELQMPDGVGLKIVGNTQYVLQLHLQNTTDGTLTFRAGVNLTYDHNPTALMAGGIWAAGRMDIDIPANATDYTVKESCTANKERHVFAVFPHMHKLGTKMDVTVTKTGATSSFYSVSPYEFGNQPIEPLDAPLAATDSIEVTCHWDNPNSTDVVYGESSDNEMCYFVTFYYPFDQLDGCIN